VRSLGSKWLGHFRHIVTGKVPAVKRAIEEMGLNTWSLAQAVLEQTGKSVFVDTTRNHQRPTYLATHPLLGVKVIHLIRDPRGNVASMIKHKGMSTAAAARTWKRINVAAARTRRCVPQESSMILKYEDLCAAPQDVINRISDFIGVERAILTPSSGEHHVIGNSMRLNGVAHIREDRSWQTSLSREQIRTISRITEATSRRLGLPEYL
jgi:hypothetical protein